MFSSAHGKLFSFYFIKEEIFGFFIQFSKPIISFDTPWFTYNKGETDFWKNARKGNKTFKGFDQFGQLIITCFGTPLVFFGRELKFRSLKLEGNLFLDK